jgi:hypothetical protein
MGRLIVECKSYLYKNKDVAERLGVSVGTVKNALKAGARHPRFKQVLKVITESGNALSMDMGMSRSYENGENSVNNQGKQARNK